MPPRVYPKLPGEDGALVRRARRGYCTVEQVHNALTYVRNPMEDAVLRVIYFCGLRASEPGLQPIEAFDSTRKTLDIVRLKGSLPHTYPLEPWVYGPLTEFVRSHRRDSKYLFPHPKDPGFPLDRHSVAHIWERAAAKAKLPEALWHPHVLKHSIATHMLERGDDIFFVQLWLGHKRLENTQVYAEITGKRLQAGQGTVRALMKDLE